jgi:hypothetical protein
MSTSLAHKGTRLEKRLEQMKHQPFVDSGAMRGARLPLTGQQVSAVDDGPIG